MVMIDHTKVGVRIRKETYKMCQKAKRYLGTLHRRYPDILRVIHTILASKTVVQVVREKILHFYEHGLINNHLLEELIETCDSRAHILKTFSASIPEIVLSRSGSSLSSIKVKSSSSDN